MNRNLTILIAEDNETEATLLKHALIQAKITNPVAIVADGQDAIDYLKGAKPYSDRRQYPFPSVIMLDLKMPRVSGFEVLEWLGKHPECSVIPTLVLSNSSEPKDIQKAYQMGANSYVVKPSHLGDFVDFLRIAQEYWAWCEKPPVMFGKRSKR